MGWADGATAAGIQQSLQRHLAASRILPSPPQYGMAAEAAACHTGQMAAEGTGQMAAEVVLMPVDERRCPGGSVGASGGGPFSRAPYPSFAEEVLPFVFYRGTSLMRKRRSLGPYSSSVP